MESIEEPVPLTASRIAIDHFVRELAGHATQEDQPETVVIFHDACYGHRFSRQKATKAMLSMIVERPERIHASILGASTAYVRLGAHHAGGTHAPHPHRTTVFPPPFRINRSDRTLDIMSSFVTNVHGTAWMSELRSMCDAAPERLASGAKELERTNPALHSDKHKLHEGDLYLASESIHAFQGALGGIADAVDAVFQPSRTSRAFVAVRPPGHHCSADHPSGFCWLNNVHVGIEYAAQTHGLTHAAIFDFDLHHGDGSQAIAWDRNSKNNIKRLNAKPTTKLKLGPDIGYYSLHDINSYPCEMGDDEKVQAASLCIDNAHNQSIWNVHLLPWKNEEDFWRLYEDRYLVLIEKARAFLEHQAARIREEKKVVPKAAIFLSAGFDASEWESPGMQRHKVNVPTEFYARFTQDVVRLAQEIGSECDGRVISVLEGGYSDRALCSGVLSHLSGLCTAPTKSSGQSGSQAADDLSSRLGGMSLVDEAEQQHKSYQKDWWSLTNLTALEQKINPTPPPQAKKSRTGPQPTYATPTESFAYKVVDANKFARSVSGTMREAPIPTRPPTPPPPEVDWVVATQELSKLLIPTDRQTKSFNADELAVTRIKKERESTTPTESTAPLRQLRDRRGKAPVNGEDTPGDDKEMFRAVSRSSRRETIDVLPSDHSKPAPARRASRRLSAGSNLGNPSAELDPDAPPVPALPNVNDAKSAPLQPSPQDAPKPRVASRSRKTDILPSQARAPISKPMSSKPSNTMLANKSNSTKSSDVDSLTSGLKKITLKVSTTREQHDLKQKEKLDAERRARALKGAETRRLNAAAKKATDGNDGAPGKLSRVGGPLHSGNHPAAPRPPAGVTGVVAPGPIQPAPATKHDSLVSDPPAIISVDHRPLPVFDEFVTAPSVIDTAPAIAPVHPSGMPSSQYLMPEPPMVTYPNEPGSDIALPRWSLSFDSAAVTQAMPELASSPVEPIGAQAMPQLSEATFPDRLPHNSNAVQLPHSVVPTVGPLPGRAPAVRPTALPVWTSSGHIPFANDSKIPRSPPKSPHKQ
jgi:histone deacetylase HOS3